VADLLFLAGLGRSGTTALLEVFSAPPEVALGVERFKRLYPRDDQPVDPALFTRERFFDFGDGLTNLTPEQAPEWAEHYASVRAKWDRARYVGDKLVAIRLQHLWETLPDARFVCIVRDLEPVAASWDRRAKDPDDRGWSDDADAHQAVKRWNTSLRRVRRAVRQRPEHAAVVEFDRFFGDPAGTALGGALDWLGLDRTPDVSAAFDAAHAHYAAKVAGKPSGLDEETRAFLDREADRQAWDDVVRLSL
jgi:hypothetical protein